MSLIDMSKMGLEDAQEPIAMQPGEEYKLRIMGVTQNIDKNGNPYLLPRLEVIDEPFSKDFTYFIGLPHKDMDAKQKNRAAWKLKSFCDCFGIDTSGESNPEDDWPGSEGYAILGLSEDDEFGEQNFIKKLIIPG